MSLSCGDMAPAGNTNRVNSNTNAANTVAANTNSTNTNSAVVTSPVETKEPETYQATVTLRVETIGEQQKQKIPALSANVARNATDRRMEFTMPAGGRVVFLDKAGTNYLVMPEKRQYAELNRESLGFDVRRMLMPEQIVNQVKNVKGVERMGEEKYNGRDAVKYRYAAVANTQTRAGDVATESFLLVDKETGLPLRSETVSQSQSGGNVQGVSGLRVITEITDLKTDAPATLFEQPTSFEKIESGQVRAQIDVIFNVFASLLSQVLQQTQTSTSSTPAQ
jgi:hypothetical protein